MCIKVPLKHIRSSYIELNLKYNDEELETIASELSNAIAHEILQYHRIHTYGYHRNNGTSLQVPVCQHEAQGQHAHW